MPKYIAYAQYTVVLEMEFEASSLDEAKDIAQNADGADFEVISHDDWIVYDVVEETE